jgi:histone chaperone ASF1
VGSAESESYDQELDSVLVGPVPQGSLKFIFQVSEPSQPVGSVVGLACHSSSKGGAQVDAPDPRKIPRNELLGVTVVLLTGSYNQQEFIRIGYYVNVEFDDPAM